MNMLIPCSLSCMYQKEGYCGLDQATRVNSLNEMGCAYFAPLGETLSPLPSPTPDITAPDAELA